MGTDDLFEVPEQPRKRGRGQLVVAFLLVAGLLGLAAGIAVTYSDFGASDRDVDNDNDAVQDVPDPPYFDLSTLDWGSIAFNSPSAMKHDETYPLEVLISPTRSVADLEAEIPGSTAGERVHVSPVMSAKLVGAAFTIDPVTPEQQPLTKEAPTHWQWDVRPKPEVRDTQDLTLTLWAHVQVGDEKHDLAVRTLRKDIKIQITRYQLVAGFVGANWQWLWTALLVPLSGWLWARKRRPQRPTNELW